MEYHVRVHVSIYYYSCFRPENICQDMHKETMDT